MQAAISSSAVSYSPVRKLIGQIRLFHLVALLLGVSLLGWAAYPVSAPNLGHTPKRNRVAVYNDWVMGNVIVFVRHAERCDRSSHPCMGDPAGITLSGEKEASTVGREFQAMGLSKTDILSSPLVRTVQTSAALFDADVTTLGWLQDCREPVLEDIAALKKPGRNLVVVTHSGCMAHYERQLGVRGTPSADYASALFVSSPTGSAPKALGYLNPASWPTFSKGMF